MSIVLASTQLFSILWIVFYEYKRKYISLFLWATLLILFGIPHFISSLSQNPEYGNEVMIQASIFVILFNLVYLFMRLILSNLKIPKVRLNMNTIESNNRKKNIDNSFINSRIKNYLFIILTLCILVLIYYSVKYFGGIFNTSWGKFFVLNQELGRMNLLRYTQFLFFASAGVVLVFKEDNNFFRYWLSVTFILFYAVLTGNRVTILPLLVAVILPIIVNNTKRISFRMIIVLSFLGFSSIYLVYFLRLLRIYGGFYVLFNTFGVSNMNSMVLDMILNGDGELGLRNAFYYFIAHDNQFPNFNKGHSYLRLLFIAIPTSLSGGLKPPDFGISMGSAWINNLQNINFSMHPTLYGDVYANFWWFGIFWGVFWASFSSAIDRVSNIKNKTIKNLLYVNFGTMFIIVGRGSVYNGIYTAFISVAVLIILFVISKIRNKR